MPVQVAKWDSARDAWTNESRINLFSELSDAYLGTFPTSGMTVSGVAYELPTWGHRTDALESSSSPDETMFGTPTARMWKGSGPEGSKSHTWLLNHGNVEAQVLVLPTPRCGDGMKADLRPHAKDTSRLEDAVAVNLLPTPGQSVTLLPTPVTQPDTGNGHARNLGKEIKMLPTPTVGMMMGGSETRSGARSGEKLLPGVAKDLALLPTPNASLVSKGGSQHPDKQKAGGHQVDLTDVAEHVLIPQAKPWDRIRHGVITSLPSDAGSLESEGQLPGQQSLLDAMEDTD